MALSPTATRLPSMIFLRATTPTASQIVLAWGIHSGELGSLTAEQGASTLLAGRRDASDDFLRDVNVEPRCREVVEEKERPRPACDHIVDAHADQIEADCVVHAHCESNVEFRSHPVGTADQDRIFDVRRNAAETREASDVAHDFGSTRGSGQRLDALNKLIACADVDAGSSVRKRTLHGKGERAAGHSRRTVVSLIVSRQS